MLKCRYEDCADKHPVAAEDEQVTCSRCRRDLGLPPLCDAGAGARASATDVIAPETKSQMARRLHAEGLSRSEIAAAVTEAWRDRMHPGWRYSAGAVVAALNPARAPECVCACECDAPDAPDAPESGQMGLLTFADMARRFEEAVHLLDAAWKKLDGPEWGADRGHAALRPLARARGVVAGYAGSLAIRAAGRR